VTELQYRSDFRPEAYRRAGLRQLMRLQRHRDGYLDVVSELARHIVETADEHRLPPTRPVDFDAVTSTFHRPEAEPGQPGAAVEPYAVGQQVYFVVAAGSRDQLAGIREDLTFYGDRATDWKPYQPALPTAIIEYARAVAEQRSMVSQPLGIEELGNLLAHAAEHNHIVVLLVDAWSTQLDSHRRALARCDDYERGESGYTSAVLVTSNVDDNETQAHWRQLADGIRSVFLGRTLAGDDVLFRPSILSHDAFSADLQVVLEVARNRVFVRGRVYRRPTDAPSGDRPILQGP
jgi:FxsC-like protein